MIFLALEVKLKWRFETLFTVYICAYLWSLLLQVQVVDDLLLELLLLDVARLVYLRLSRAHARLLFAHFAAATFALVAKLIGVEI